ncbi:adenomatous polyposis coli protein-like isoform X2 [Planococcus citri]|uniref:adenomatous polyposis coli protein-like isoform X2 n=1 Tax=Planococcus citri TaxID=170843 RepID=UPI0031F7AFF6
MNSPQKTSSNSFNDTEGTPCDIKSNLLIARLLGQHTKEERSSEMKEQEEKTMSMELIDSVEESVHRTHSEQYLAARVQMVYDLLSTLNPNDKEEMSKTFLAMSSSPEKCILLRQSGCLPILLQLIHGEESTKTVRKQALKSLQCIVQHNSDDKQGRRENRVFKYIEEILDYCEKHNDIADENSIPTPAVSSLMKLSFDEEYRHAMCQLGALRTLAKLVQTDHESRLGDVNNLSQDSITLRRYAGMALTNLTFGDITNKALLCSLKPFMVALVAQLNSPNEDLCQVTAGVLRNLSWRADPKIKDILREVGTVTSLMKTALRMTKESTLKAVLSALWNLSAHNHLNKMDICKVDGAIEYLVKMLNYQAPSGTLVIVESVGGILRNISSIIALRDDYRVILRNYNCLRVLLHQLKSPSLTIVSNACGTLWNLTARCAEDQITLCELGAVPMLRSLIHSKHKMISVASTAALKNLLACRADANIMNDSNRGNATLMMRKRRALEQEIDAKLNEQSENLGQLEVSEMSYDSMTPPPMTTTTSSFVASGERSANYNSKSGTVTPTTMKNNITGESSEPMIKSGNSVRFNLSLSFDESDKIKENGSLTRVSKSPVGANKGILVKSEENRGKKESFSYSDDDDNNGHASKTNGFRKVEEPYNVDDSFGDYAETDLDQPTDYSLRFREQGNDLRKNEMLVTGSVAHNESKTYEDDKKMVAENALETPLMFSRSSSLDSVSSCGGEHADDRSSVVSEVSRVVSGVVSPSELPDSPTQTVPSSPYPVAKNNQFFSPEDECKPKVKSALPYSVFEDSVTVFKDENTPIQFSVATSLSSLTFDDEPQLVNELAPVNEEATESKPNACFVKSTSSSSNTSTGNTNTLLNKDSGPATFDVKEDTLDVELTVEEQQAMLKACIDSGKPSSQTSIPQTTKSFVISTEDEHDTARSIIPLLPDSTINFCTEDTPISISHAASNSDLSLLCPSEDSFLQNSILPLSSCNDQDDVELSSEDQEKLLNFCIAKGLQSLSHDSNDTFHERKSSQSSTLSEITEDLLAEDQTLIKDCTPESANLVAISTTESEFSFANEMVNKELSEEEEKNLLNQCIALGMRSMKESSDLENIGPPSFLDQANLDSSLTNVEEIIDYPPTKNQKVTKTTPKQKRHEIKNRYNTYTVKLSPTKSPPRTITENGKKNAAIKERRSSEKDRFKTRTLTKGDFEEISRNHDSKPPKSPQSEDACNTSSDAECNVEHGKAKIAKPVTRVKSGIPIVKSKLPTSKSTSNIKSAGSTSPEFPGNLQRQNTFTKDEPSGIPVRKNSFKNSSKANVPADSSQFKSGIPSRIKEPSPKGSRINGSSDRSPEMSKNRWSVSENNLNLSSNVKAISSTSLNSSSNYSATKVSPSASHSALPVRRESAGRSTFGYKK